MESKTIISEDNIARTRDLLAMLENGDEEAAKEVIDDLTQIRESDLYQEMGKLTRELHDAISSFGMDESIAKLAEDDIPDARQRLRHVITMTDDAANKTLTAVEDSMPLCEGLEDRSKGLAVEWGRFKKRDMNLLEFKQLAGRLDEFFVENTGDAGKIRSSLNDVLMAQDFQDLTSQIIKKVITLVESVESNLVEIIKITGAQKNPESNENDSDELAGPVVPGVNENDSISDQDDVDDLLSSLGF